jgi:uncharacterized protein with GYD domain
MVTYVSLINLTDQGIQKIKESPSRLNQAKKLARKYGVKFKQTLYTVGPYDIICILEGPDDDAINAFALAAAQNGNVRTTSMRAYTPAEMTELTKGI